MNDIKKTLYKVVSDKDKEKQSKKSKVKKVADTKQLNTIYITPFSD